MSRIVYVGVIAYYVHLIILKVLEEIQIEYFIRNFLDDVKLFVLLVKAKAGGSVAEGKYLAIYTYL